MTDGDEVFEFGWGRTVWFSFEGTGGPITVDPGGSNFDTVVAVYAAPATAWNKSPASTTTPVSGRHKGGQRSIPTSV